MLNKFQINHLYILVGVYVTSRIWIYNTHPFLFDKIEHYWQYLDMHILHYDLLRGLFYLHVQPPLFNVFLGLVLKVSPDGYIIFVGLYFIMGLIIACGTYMLMLSLRIHHVLALIVSIYLIMFPSIIHAERWLFYAYPLTMMLVLSALWLSKSISSNNDKYFILFVGMITAIVLTRSFFHLIVWMIPVIIIPLVVIWKENRHWLKRGIIISIIGFLLASIPYLKNFIMFDFFTGSTWQGMNITKMTTYVGNDNIKN